MKTSLGTGTLYLMSAKVFKFILAYFVSFIIGRALGPESFGIFGVVIAITTIFSIMLNSGIPRAAAKFIAEDDSFFYQIKSHAIRLQLIYSVLIYTSFLLMLNVITGILNDASLYPHLLLASLLIPITAFLALYNGFLSGFKFFRHHARIPTMNWTIKLLSISALLLLGLKLTGVILGFLFGALVALFLSRHYVNKLCIPEKITSKKFPGKKIIQFSVPLVLFSIGFDLLLSIDLLSLKAILKDDSLTGFYNAANVISKIPYELLSVLGFTLLPSISKSTSSGNLTKTQRYINDSLRYLLLILAPVVAVISATSGELIHIFYSDIFLEAAKPLSILVVGHGLLTVFMILGTIITGYGKPQITFLFILLMIPADILLNLTLIPTYKLEGAAISTCISAGLGLILSSCYVLQKFKTLVNFRSVIRISTGSALLYLIGVSLPFNGLMLLLEYAILLVVYVSFLVLSRELDQKDKTTFKKLIPLKNLW